MQILLVEDETRLAHIIERGLKGENFLVDIAYDGEEAISKLINSYDVIVLDVMLPKKNGYEVLEYIRAHKGNLPVIFLTARGELEDKVSGLTRGADDYLTKPFAFEELLARIHALIRRSTKTESILQIGNLELNTLTKNVKRAGKDILLSSTEYRLLEYIMRYENHVLSETKLLEHVWDHNYDGFSNVVSVYIRYLRNKIDKPFPEEKPLIHTVRGLGYKISRE